MESVGFVMKGWKKGVRGLMVCECGFEWEWEEKVVTLRMQHLILNLSSVHRFSSRMILII